MKTDENRHEIMNPLPTEDGGVTAVAVAGVNSPWFSGHFPADPILPGIAQLSIVSETLEMIFPDIGATGFRRIRFRRIIRPEEEMEISIMPDKGRGARNFEIRVEGETACTGILLTNASKS